MSTRQELRVTIPLPEVERTFGEIEEIKNDVTLALAQFCLNSEIEVVEMTTEKAPIGIDALEVQIERSVK